jgi:hypothetical protein
MFRRRVKLIQPRLQLTLVGWFLAVSVVGLLLQFALLSAFLARFAAGLPEGGARFAEQGMEMLLTSLGATLVLIVPVTLGVGILTTFKIAGPIYRFERYFEALARGEWRGPCRIRKGDALQVTCDKLNAAVDALRAAQDARGPRQAA